MGNHTPIRECVLCRKKFLKNELLRLVKTDCGISIDETKKAQGRGAYICMPCTKNPDLLKKRALDRAFRMKIQDEIYSCLAQKE